jgi:hypothetical protein
MAPKAVLHVQLLANEHDHVGDNVVELVVLHLGTIDNLTASLECPERLQAPSSTTAIP